MFKRLGPLLGVVLAGLVTSAAGAAQTDPLTRLPLYPGIQHLTSDAQPVCGTNVSNATYSPVHGDLATVDRWYASHLSGFNVLHGKNRNYPYDVFVNGDGTASVSILGSGPKTGVEAVVYHHNAKPASMSNLTNWLDGADPLCR